jgi:predicted transcriptional regulator
MKRELKTKLKEVSTVIDEGTGEVLSVETKTHKYLSGSKEEFFLLYADILPIMKTIHQAEARIFFFLVEYNIKGRIDISRKLRFHMADDIDLNEQTITRVLPSLVAKGLLILHKDGMYQINPRYIHKGSTGERDSALKSVIEDGCKNC